MEPEPEQIRLCSALSRQPRQSAASGPPGGQGRAASGARTRLIKPFGPRLAGVDSDLLIGPRIWIPKQKRILACMIVLSRIQVTVLEVQA